MKMEDIIRERHKLEDRIPAFLAQIKTFKEHALLLDVRVLELAMGRVYDQMRDATEEFRRLDMMFKGRLIKAVYDSKKAGAKHGLMRRMSGMSYEFCPKWDVQTKTYDPVKPFVEYAFKYPVPINEELASAWAGNDETPHPIPLAFGSGVGGC